MVFAGVHVVTNVVCVLAAVCVALSGGFKCTTTIHKPYTIAVK